MYKNNDGSDEDHILQNQFTAYLVTALRRTKVKHIRKKRYRQYEVPLDYLNEHDGLMILSDLLTKLPVIEQLENEKLVKILKTYNEQSVHIFIEKVIGDKSFVEIADTMGLSYNSVQMRYYRILKKLRKELDKNDKHF